MSAVKDLTGKQFGRLTVLFRDGSNTRGRAMWQCGCICGGKVKVVGSNLVNGHTKSCNCLQRDTCRNTATIHGMCSLSCYQVWRSMRQRCLNKADRSYHNYGGRGIAICNEWRSAENFVIWALPSGYKPGLELERIDNDGNYDPGNCRWATDHEQTRNRRNNIALEFRGKRMIVVDWAQEVNIKASTLYYRIHAGWSVERTLTYPLRRAK